MLREHPHHTKMDVLCPLKVGSKELPRRLASAGQGIALLLENAA
jgi:hypothetical protein